MFEDVAGRVPGVDSAALYHNNILSRFVRDYVAAQNRRLGRHGLATARHFALGIISLAGEAGITAGALAERLAITRGTMTGLIDGLERAGLVERRRHDGDRRKVRLVCTPAGRLKLETYWPAHAQSLCEFIGVLSHAEQRRLVRLLTKLSGGMWRLANDEAHSDT